MTRPTTPTNAATRVGTVCRNSALPRCREPCPCRGCHCRHCSRETRSRLSLSRAPSPHRYPPISSPPPPPAPEPPPLPTPLPLLPPLLDRQTLAAAVRAWATMAGAFRQPRGRPGAGGGTSQYTSTFKWQHEVAPKRTQHMAKSSRGPTTKGTKKNIYTVPMLNRQQDKPKPTSRSALMAVRNPPASPKRPARLHFPLPSWSHPQEEAWPPPRAPRGGRSPHAEPPCPSPPPWPTPTSAAEPQPPW